MDESGDIGDKQQRILSKSAANNITKIYIGDRERGFLPNQHNLCYEERHLSNWHHHESLSAGVAFGISTDGLYRVDAFFFFFFFFFPCRLPSRNKEKYFQ